MNALRPWTDDELGLVADRIDAPAHQLALELNRSPDAIYKARARIRNGWVREREAWTATEDAYILAAPSNLSAAQIAAKLPGRTLHAVKGRRKKLGAPHAKPGNIYSPLAIGQRPLIAKTCRKCGYLLPGEKFYSRKSRIGYLSECAYCIADHTKAHRAENQEPKRLRDGEKAEAMSRWTRHVQAITSKTANRNRLPYTEADFEILSNPKLSLLAKALVLHRTYQAVSSACARNSFSSSAGANYGSRSDEMWLIDNPNADRIDEITASLKQEFETAGVPFPAWDWDDEDLKETA